MSASERITLTLRQEQDYRCQVHFGDGLPDLQTDEPAPLGTGAGPSPVQLLLSAVANCLTASLLFALRKFKQDAGRLTCEASATVGRNPENRLRVLAIDVTLSLGRDAQGLEHLERILGQFEAFCTVTQSIAQGIPVHLTVKDASGAVLAAPPA